MKINLKLNKIQRLQSKKIRPSLADYFNSSFYLRSFKKWNYAIGIKRTKFALWIYLFPKIVALQGRVRHQRVEGEGEVFGLRKPCWKQNKMYFMIFIIFDKSHYCHNQRRMTKKNCFILTWIVALCNRF